MTSFLDAATRIAEILTWPVVVLVALLVYRRTIASLVAKLASRLTKLSIMKVELHLAAAEPSGPSIVLQQLRDTTQAAVADSSLSLFTQVRDATPADSAEIDLGTGDEWITSRLFIAAALLERMRGLRAMVFVETHALLRRSFVALASPSIVRWSLANRYPWLELAYTQATQQALVAQLNPPAPPIFPPEDPKVFLGSNTIISSNGGALDGDRAEILARQFLLSIQEYTPTPAPPPPAEWVQLSGYRERATWVTTQILRELLPPSAFEQGMDEMRRETQERRVRAVLKQPGSFVALVNSDRQLTRLVDRGTLLEQAASELGHEESNS
jgi:hypothetical protein